MDQLENGAIETDQLPRRGGEHDGAVMASRLDAPIGASMVASPISSTGGRIRLWNGRASMGGFALRNDLRNETACPANAVLLRVARKQ